VPLAYYKDYYPPPPHSYPVTTTTTTATKKIHHQKPTTLYTTIPIDETLTFVRLAGADLASFVRCSTRDCSYIIKNKKKLKTE
jgi:hypothetical protein